MGVWSTVGQSLVTPFLLSVLPVRKGGRNRKEGPTGGEGRSR